MWGQLSCIVEQLNVQSAKLLIAYVNKVLSKLQEENTRSSVLAYFHEVDKIVINMSFKQTRWSKDPLDEAEIYIYKSRQKHLQKVD